MSWRRNRSQLKEVPRADDGSALVDGREAHEVSEKLKAELSKRPGPFPVAEWVKLRNAELSRRAEIAELRQRRALPYKAGAAVAAAGAGSWGVAALAELLAGPAGHLIVAAASPAATAIACLALRLTHREQLAAWSGNYRSASVGTVSLIAASTALGPGWWSWLLGGVLVGGTALVAQPWMRAHQAPLALPAGPEKAAIEQAPPGLVEVIEDEGHQIEARWATEVITTGGAIPRAQLLTERTDLNNGYRWTGQLGKNDYYSKVAGLTEPVAAALKKQAKDVLIEPYPDDASRFYLTVITRDILAGGVAYMGPIYNNGRIPIGLHPDGSLAEVTIKDTGGVYPIALTGDPRMGKSVTFEAICLALRNSGEWMILFADGDPGAGSSAIVPEVAHWPEAGPREVLRQLECMESILASRQALKGTLTVDPDTGLLIPITDPTRQRPAAKMLPCPDYPGWALMIDEGFQFVQDPWLSEQRYVPRLEAVVRTGPKYGMAVVYATHSRLNPDYGTSSLKGAVHSRNSLAFRAQSSQESANVNGILVYPSALPHGGGYAWSTHSNRVAMLRTGYPIVVPSGPFPQVTPDEDSWLAAQPFWPEQERDPTVAHQAARARLAEWRRQAQARARGEDLTDIREQAPTRIASIQGEAMRDRSCTSFGYPQFDDFLRDAANVLPFRSRTTIAEDDGIDRRALLAATDDRLNQADRQVLAAVYLGNTRSSQIIEHTNLAGPRVSISAKKLAGFGYLVDGGYGVWTLPEKADAS